MPTYSKELKEKIITRILSDKNQNISELSREFGIHESTLRKWKNSSMQKELNPSTKFSIANNWSTQDKFLIVLETATLTEIELAEYCRKNGLYPEQIKAWKDACIQANGGVAEEASRLNQELKREQKEKRQLEQELLRKEKALAETAALLVLRKKVNAIWGDREGE